MKKIFIFIFVFFVCLNSVDAEVCTGYLPSSGAGGGGLVDWPPVDVNNWPAHSIYWSMAYLCAGNLGMGFCFTSVYGHCYDEGMHYCGAPCTFPPVWHLYGEAFDHYLLKQRDDCKPVDGYRPEGLVECWASAVYGVKLDHPGCGHVNCLDNESQGLDCLCYPICNIDIPTCPTGQYFNPDSAVCGCVNDSCQIQSCPSGQHFNTDYNVCACVTDCEVLECQTGYEFNFDSCSCEKRCIFQ